MDMRFSASDSTRDWEFDTGIDDTVSGVSSWYWEPSVSDGKVTFTNCYWKRGVCVDGEATVEADIEGEDGDTVYIGAEIDTYELADPRVTIIFGSAFTDVINATAPAADSTKFKMPLYKSVVVETDDGLSLGGFTSLMNVPGGGLYA